jgi:hypothetical protein
VKIVHLSGWFSVVLLLVTFLTITIQPVSSPLSTWTASVTVSPSDPPHIIPGQKVTFTVSVKLVSYANINIKTIIVWLKLIQINGGSQFSIVSKDFRSGPISGNPPYQATLTFQSSSTTPVGLWLYHIVSADSLQDLSTCPTQVGNAMYCGDSGTFGVYVNAPFSI